MPFLKGSKAYRVNPGAKPIEAAIRNGRIACVHESISKREIRGAVAMPGLALTTTYAATALATPAAAVDCLAADAT